MEPEDVRDLIKEMYSSSGWIQIPKDFLRIIPLEEAFVLAFLINEDRKRKVRLEGDWFRCTRAHLKSLSFLSKDRQAKIFKSLKNKDFIEARMVGMPPSRFVRIHYLTIRAGILEFRSRLISHSSQITTIERRVPATNTKDSKKYKFKEGPSLTSFEEGLREEKHTHLIGNSSMKNEIDVSSGTGRFINSIKGKKQTYGYTCAKQLHKHIPINHGQSLKSWSDHFQILIKQHGVTTVQNTLDWYCDHFSQITKPKITSANSFRKCFVWLKDMMDKDTSDIVPSYTTEEIIQHYLNPLRWPKNSKSKLPIAVEITYQNFVSLWRKIKAYTEANPKFVVDQVRKKKHYTETTGTRAPQHVQAAHYLMEGSVFLPSNYTKHWFLRLHNRIGDWDSWHGDIIKEAWDGDLENKSFQNMMCQVLTEHFGNTTVWFKLAKEVA